MRPARSRRSGRPSASAARRTGSRLPRSPWQRQWVLPDRWSRVVSTATARSPRRGRSARRVRARGRLRGGRGRCRRRRSTRRHGDRLRARRFSLLPAQHPARVPPRSVALVGEALQGGVEEAAVAGGRGRGGGARGDAGRAVRDAGQRPLGGEPASPAEAALHPLGAGQEVLPAADGELPGPAPRRPHGVQAEQRGGGARRAGRPRRGSSSAPASRAAGGRTPPPRRGAWRRSTGCPSWASVQTTPPHPGEGADRAQQLVAEPQLVAEGDHGAARQPGEALLAGDLAEPAEEEGDAGEAEVEVRPGELQRPVVAPACRRPISQWASRSFRRASLRAGGRSPRRRRSELAPPAGSAAVRLPRGVVSFEVVPRADLQGADGVAEHARAGARSPPRERTQASRARSQAGGGEEVRDPLAAARPQVAGAGQGGEHGHVVARQVAVLGGDHPASPGRVSTATQRWSQEAVAVEGVAEVIGVEALARAAGRRRASGAGSPAPRRRRSGQGAVRRGELVPPRAGAGGDILSRPPRSPPCIGRPGGLAVQGRPVLRAGDVTLPRTNRMRSVPTSWSFSTGFGISCAPPEPRPLMSTPAFSASPQLRPGRRPMRRTVAGAAGRPAPLRAGRAEPRSPGVEERLEIHHHGVLAGRDQVLVVHVRGAEEVEQGEIAPLPLVEAPDLACGGAGRRGRRTRPSRGPRGRAPGAGGNRGRTRGFRPSRGDPGRPPPPRWTAACRPASARARTWPPAPTGRRGGNPRALPGPSPAARARRRERTGRAGRRGRRPDGSGIRG